MRDLYAPLLLKIQPKDLIHLKPTNPKHIAVAPFRVEYIGTTLVNRTRQHWNRQRRSYLHIYPYSTFINAPFQNLMLTSDTSFRYLKGLKLAHSITNYNQDNFQINVLIGTEFYWMFVKFKGRDQLLNCLNSVTFCLALYHKLPLWLNNLLLVVTLTVTTVHMST